MKAEVAANAKSKRTKSQSTGEKSGQQTLRQTEDWISAEEDEEQVEVADLIC